MSANERHSRASKSIAGIPIHDLDIQDNDYSIDLGVQQQQQPPAATPSLEDQLSIIADNITKN